VFRVRFFLADDLFFFVILFFPCTYMKINDKYNKTKLNNDNINDNKKKQILKI